MGKTGLSDVRLCALENGFLGPRPGSNALPLLQLWEGASRINGETLDAWFRAGYLVAVPATEPAQIKGGNAGPYGEIPDVELTFAWTLTPAGRAALSRTAPSSGRAVAGTAADRGRV